MAAPAKKFDVNGFVSPGFEKVAETFRSNLDNGIEKGGNFAAYYRGELVVNIWGGFSDHGCRRFWKEDTLSTFFSSTKAVSAFVVAHMVDRGLLDYKERVCKYWPEFAQNGKENITLEQLLSNQAGLITLEKKYWLAEMRDDPTGLSKKLAEQKPYWSPGTKHGYHPLTFGLYLDQIVRHADPKCRSLSQYFKEEMADPFDIEFYIGLPKGLFHRATRVQLSENFTAKEYAKRSAQFFKGDIALSRITSAKAARDFRTTIKMNDPDMRELPVPSTHGHGTAANTAKLFGIVANGGTFKGKQLLSETVIRKFTVPIVAGIDVSFGMDAAWSLGTHLITTTTGNDQILSQWVMPATNYGWCIQDSPSLYQGWSSKRKCLDTEEPGSKRQCVHSPCGMGQEMIQTAEGSMQCDGDRDRGLLVPLQRHEQTSVPNNTHVQMCIAENRVPELHPFHSHHQTQHVLDSSENITSMNNNISNGAHMSEENNNSISSPMCHQNNMIMDLQDECYSTAILPENVMTDAEYEAACNMAAAMESEGGPDPSQYRYTHANSALIDRKSLDVGMDMLHTVGSSLFDQSEEMRPYVSDIY